MKRFQFLLLDAGPIIKLFELGLWDKFVQKCDIAICRTVVEQELVYAETENNKEYIEYGLKSYEEKGLIKIVDVSPSIVKTFHDKIPLFYDIHSGEKESLAFLFDSSEEWRFCASEGPAFSVLGYLNKSEQGISLEEVFQKIGFSANFEWQYSKKFREKFIRKGQSDSIQNA